MITKDKQNFWTHKNINVDTDTFSDKKPIKSNNNKCTITFFLFVEEMSIVSALHHTIYYIFLQ